VDVNDEDRSVDLTYNLAEASSDQLELSGGWGGSSGLILQAGVTFNNFSARNLFNRRAWRPLPMGDGQQLSLNVTTYGTFRQSYQVSFTEPWFRGRQTPVGFALGYTSQRSRERSIVTEEGDTTRVRDQLGSASVRLFYRQQLRWPDDFFQTGTDLGLRFYNITGGNVANTYGLPEGTSRELTLSQSLTRNALNSPLFPTAGSNLGFSVTVAPPVPGFIQYHKWDLNTAWYAPLTGRSALSFRTQFGYIGSLTGDDVEFQRYLVGGSPLDVQGSFRGFGKDLVFLRGYPIEVVGPRRNGEAVGGRILTKYGAELQLVAVQTPQLSLAPYLFAEAANTYDSFEAFDPGRLYRSAGLGLRVFLPILGMVDLNYGYQNDLPKWRFQFSLGAGQ
jgi:outer membrane protein insertion porin family